MSVLALVEAPRTREDHWVSQINAAHSNSVEGVIMVGRLLIEAKAGLDHGCFMEMVKKQLPFSQSTANRLMKIASHPAISNSAHWPNLPTSWRTLYEISKHDPQAVEIAIRQERIKADTTAERVTALFRERRRAERRAKPSSPPSFTALLRKALGAETWGALQRLDEDDAEDLCYRLRETIIEELERRGGKRAA